MFRNIRKFKFPDSLKLCSIFAIIFSRLLGLPMIFEAMPVRKRDRDRVSNNSHLLLPIYELRAKSNWKRIKHECMPVRDKCIHNVFDLTHLKLYCSIFIAYGDTLLCRRQNTLRRNLRRFLFHYTHLYYGYSQSGSSLVAE